MKKLLQKLNLKGSLLFPTTRKNQNKLAWSKSMSGKAKAITHGGRGDYDEGAGYRRRTHNGD